MKNWTVLMTIAFLFSAMYSTAQVKGTFTDSRDGKTYKTVKIGTQTWFAENLAYKGITTKSNDNYTFKYSDFEDFSTNRTYIYKVYNNSSVVAKFELYYGFKPHYDKKNEIWYTCPDLGLWGIIFQDNSYYSFSEKTGGYNKKYTSIDALMNAWAEYYFQNKWGYKNGQTKTTETSGCVAYNNDPNNAKVYGYLYTWDAAKDACPTGWHLPSDDEWRTLATYLGGQVVAGSKLKETGTTHWASPNIGANNKTGFSALPGGSLGYLDGFGQMGYFGNWWSVTEDKSFTAFSWKLAYLFSDLISNSYGLDKRHGFSVRCVKD